MNNSDRETAAKVKASRVTATRRYNLGVARTALGKAKETVSRLEAEYYKAWHDVVVSESLREGE